MWSSTTSRIILLKGQREEGMQGRVREERVESCLFAGVA